MALNAGFAADLAGRISQLKADKVYKTLNHLASPQAAHVRMEGRGEVLIMSSNNYLGLTTHPRLIEAALDATRRYGVGTGSVRTIAGTMDLHMARLVTWHAAWTLDQGGLCLQDSSRAKVMVSEAVWRVVDRCVQVLGGQGVTGETVVARIFADIRGFRIYDGPSEVHRWSLAKHAIKNLRH